MGPKFIAVFVPTLRVLCKFEQGEMNCNRWIIIKKRGLTIKFYFHKSYHKGDLFMMLPHSEGRGVPGNSQGGLLKASANLTQTWPSPVILMSRVLTFLTHTPAKESTPLHARLASSGWILGVCSRRPRCLCSSRRFDKAKDLFLPSFHSFMRVFSSHSDCRSVDEFVLG